MALCPWPIDVETCCVETGLDPEKPADAAKIASVVTQVTQMMALWSGFRFGGCRTVRPLSPCGVCRYGCCSSGDCLALHDTSGVTEVRLYGEVVPDVEYHFSAEHGMLCAVPPRRWPVRDALFENVGSLEVDTLIGEQPDEWALSVAAELACEILRSCAGKDCRLPKRATSVSSQGVTITIQPDELMYSIPNVIAWVNSVNPHRATAPARIFSPEAKRAAVTPARGGFRAPWR